MISKVRLPNLAKHLLFLTLSCLLISCSTKEKPSRQYVGPQLIPEAPIAEMGFVNPAKLPLAGVQVNPMRAKQLQDTATTLGATGALAWRTQQINASLQKNADKLNQIFDFNQLMLPHNVVPPVLLEADNSLNLDDAESIRLASKTYRIAHPARFATTPPNWREYLSINFAKPDVPDTALLPKDQAEASIWNCYLKIGWEQGLNQANAVFNANLNRLKRDYSGMVLYRKLLAQNIVSAPFVAKAELGVTGDANEIRINDQVLRITSQSELQPDSSQWKAVITNNSAPNFFGTGVSLPAASTESNLYK